jgi:hypothetical protein
MGNGQSNTKDLSTVLKKLRLTSEIDINNAHFMVGNALNHILSKKTDKRYKIIGSGVVNIFIGTSDGEYYRVCYRAYEHDVIDKMIKTQNVISSGDYGFLVPLKSNITEDYIYHMVQLLKDPAGSVSFDELHELFSKVLGIGEYELAWVDYHNDNVKRLNGELKIIDFDCQDQKDIDEIIDKVLKKHKLTKNPDELSNWAFDKSSVLSVISTFDLSTIFAVIHGYTDPYNYMRLRFNLELFQLKHNIHSKCFNRAVYAFLMNEPFRMI